MATFPSKHDAWLVLISSVALVVELGGAVLLWRNASPFVLRYLSALVLLGGASLIVWTLCITDYAVEARSLRIRSGPFRWTVPIAAIQSVRPSRDPTAAPAWSLDRLHVAASGKDFWVSPRDQRGFLVALAASDPELAWRGDWLERARETAAGAR